MIALAGEVFVELLSAAAREELAGLAKRQTYGSGELIHSRGDPGAGMGVVISGSVRLCRIHPDGTQTFVSVVRRGQHYGDVLHFSPNRRRTHDALAIEPTVIDHFDQSAFERVLDNPELVRALYRITAQRLTGSMAMADDLRGLTRETHLAKVLLHLLSRSPSSDCVGCVQDDLANLLGTSTMTISKCLGALKQAGLIETGYRMVRIPDPLRLKRWLANKVRE